MPKKGEMLGQFADLGRGGGGLARKRVMVFLRGVDALMYTMMIHTKCGLNIISEKQLLYTTLINKKYTEMTPTPLL